MIKRYLMAPGPTPVPPEAPKLDLITLVLNYHDISYLPIDRAKMNQRLYAALKPGGRLVIVDHAARAGTGIADGKTLHRIDEAVLRRVEGTQGAELVQAGVLTHNESQALHDATEFFFRVRNQLHHRAGKRLRLLLRQVMPGALNDPAFIATGEPAAIKRGR